MNKISKILGSALLVFAPVMPAAADTLADIYQLALTNDPELRAANAALKIGKESIPLGRAGILPKIDASMEFTDGDGDTSNFRSLNFDPSGGGLSVPVGASGHEDNETEYYSVSLSQPIFDLPAWFNFKRGYDLDGQAEAQFAADQQTTIVRVTEAYIDVLRANDNLVTSQAEQRAIGRQLEQTKERFEVGLLPITDVHEAQAVYDGATVNTLENEAALDISFEALGVITGQQHFQLAGLSADFPVRPTEPADSASWVEFSQNNNFKLKVVRLAMTAAEKRANAAKAEHLPTVTASLTWSNFHDDGHFKKKKPLPRETQPYSIDDEPTVFAIRMDAPLFTGGLVSAERRKAYQQYIQTQEMHLLAQRATTQQARSQHLLVQTNAARVKARSQAITSAQSALEATEAGYDVGTRNIVDVLLTQRGLFQAKRNYANARYDYLVSMLKLRQVAGQLSPEHLANLDRWLDPGLKVNRAAAPGSS
ncbi:MAG: type I secretion protein TolC [Gammaproteobacteria bacterium]|nr:MAG: type I secretion protein TolC [Gammaproteobacteria bacterium]